MGSWFSSDETKVEEKTIDTNGQVNNNIIIQEARDTHQQMILNEKLLTATYVLCLLEIVKFIMYCIGAYRRHIKNQYRNETKNGRV